jgi:hypothetical protein
MFEERNKLLIIFTLQLFKFHKVISGGCPEVFRARNLVLGRLPEQFVEL